MDHCSVCLQLACLVQFDNCRHQSVCSKCVCYLDNMKCPICRTDISTVSIHKSTVILQDLIQSRKRYEDSLKNKAYQVVFTCCNSDSFVNYIQQRYPNSSVRSYLFEYSNIYLPNVRYENYLFNIRSCPFWTMSSKITCDVIVVCCDDPKDVESYSKILRRTYPEIPILCTLSTTTKETEGSLLNRMPKHYRPARIIPSKKLDILMDEIFYYSRWSRKISPVKTMCIFM